MFLYQKIMSCLAKHMNVLYTIDKYANNNNLFHRTSPINMHRAVNKIVQHSSKQVPHLLY